MWISHIVRAPLPRPLQWWFDPPTGVVTIDPGTVPATDEATAAILTEIQHELLGQHHLAPHVVYPRPALHVVDGDRAHTA